MFIISKEARLFKPVKFELFGATYETVPLTRPIWVKIQEFEARRRAGDVTAFHEAVATATNVPPDVLDQLDIKEIRALNDYLVQNAVLGVSEEVEKEKNSSGPGEIKSDESLTPSPGSSPTPSSTT